jgi:hypothetical protein
MKSVLFSGILLAGVWGWACADIRLDTDGALAHYPVFDQAVWTNFKDTNICYAATAATLIDSYRASKIPPESLRSEMTSPWWVAVLYSSIFKRDPNPDLEFGEPDKALEVLKKEGVCTQADLFENKPTEDIVRFHSMLKEFYQSASSQNTSEEPSSLQKKLEDIMEKVDFVKEPAQLAQISLKAIQQKTFVTFLRTIFHGKCEGKLRASNSYDVERIDADRLKLSSLQKAEIIQDTLEKSQPIEVSICSQVLRNPEYVPAENFRKCLRHSILLVGSRKVSGQCQYLLRDTYGPESCNRKRKGSPWYHPDLECQKGQVWVPAEALLVNTWGMTRISGSVEKIEGPLKAL